VIFGKVVDGKMVIGASLLKIDGRALYSYSRSSDNLMPNLIARQSFTAKKQRSAIFPILGNFILSVTKYKKRQVGIALISSDKYLQLLAVTINL
jgi:hypothetical protein